MKLGLVRYGGVGIGDIRDCVLYNWMEYIGAVGPIPSDGQRKVAILEVTVILEERRIYTLHENIGYEIRICDFCRGTGG